MKNLKTRELKIIFIVYCILVFLFIVIKINDDVLLRMSQIQTKRQWGYLHINLTPFRTIANQLWMISSNILPQNAILNLSANVFAFLPLGYFLPRIYPKLSKLSHSFAMYLLIITCIEAFQHLSSTGYFDIDDIILNVFGCLIGYICFYFLRVKARETQMSNII